MSAWMIAAVAVVWAIGWLATATGMFRHFQRQYPTIARENRQADATFALVYCLLVWPLVACIWMLGRTIGRFIMWAGADDPKDWRP